MNIVGTMVGMSLMATAAPAVLQMSIAPAEAQARARNFAVAETAAVVFSAKYEGTTDIPVDTDTCTTEAREDTENAYSVTCTHGSGKYVQSVTRAFRLAVPEKDLKNGDGASAAGRQFEFECECAESVVASISLEEAEEEEEPSRCRDLWLDAVNTNSGRDEEGG